MIKIIKNNKNFDRQENTNMHTFKLLQEQMVSKNLSRSIMSLRATLEKAEIKQRGMDGLIRKS